MASGLTRNQLPGDRLRVRIPCPPLVFHSDFIREKTRVNTLLTKTIRYRFLRDLKRLYSQDVSAGKGVLRDFCFRYQIWSRE